MLFTRYRFLLLCCLIVTLSISACHHTPRTEAAPRPLLILVSIDGYRADYLTETQSPVLFSLAQQGAHAQQMRASFPSLTFPNHYTLVTGLVPDHHGLVNNTMTDPTIPNERFALRNREAVQNPAWWNDAQPLWNTAREAGLRSATMFWPGSEAPIRGHHPHYWHTFDQNLSAKDRVKQVLDWVDLPADERPHFITLYFDEVDHQGHFFGPDSAEARQAVAHTDHAIGQLIAGLKQRQQWANTNLVVVSDHGMAETPANQVLALDEHIPRRLFQLVTAGTVAGLEARKGKDDALAEAMKTPLPHAQCWHKSAIPARFNYGSHRRVPTYICLADEGWTLTDRTLKKRYAPPAGSHGFDPDLPSMAALFVAHGPDFRPGAQIRQMRNVDVYPLLAQLLGIQPEPNDGDPAITTPLLRDGSKSQKK